MVNGAIFDSSARWRQCGFRLLAAWSCAAVLDFADAAGEEIAAYPPLHPKHWDVKSLLQSIGFSTGAGASFPAITIALVTLQRIAHL